MQSRIVARLTAPVIAVSGFLLVVALGAAWYVRDSQRHVTEMLDSHVASIQAAQELEISLRAIQVQLYEYLKDGKSQDLDSVPGLRLRADEALAEAERLATTEQEQLLMRQVRTGYTDFFVKYDKMKQKRPEGDYGEIREMIERDIKSKILDPAREYLRVNQGMLNRATKTNEELSQRLTIGLIGLGTCGSIGGLLGGWVIAMSLRRSLLDTDRVLRDTAAQLGQAAHSPLGLPPAGSTSETALQRVTQAAAAVLNRLKQTERDALRAEQLAWVGQMAAGIAHEIRNPLTVIKLLVQAATDPRRAVGFRPKDLQVLEGEILRLEQIVSTFLDFARPPRPEKKEVSTRELLQECMASVAARAELQRVELRFESPPELPTLDADAGQLRQVFYNLMFNALDALTTGGTISVGATVVGGDPGGPTVVVIRIADSGPGLPSGLEGRIFDPFVSTKETGLGLGLSICKRIVEAHGGSIYAANGPAGGAAFTVRLPAVRASALPGNGVLASHGAS